MVKPLVLTANSTGSHHDNGVQTEVKTGSKKRNGGSGKIFRMRLLTNFRSDEILDEVVWDGEWKPKFKSDEINCVNCRFLSSVVNPFVYLPAK